MRKIFDLKMIKPRILKAKKFILKQKSQFVRILIFMILVVIMLIIHSCINPTINKSIKYEYLQSNQTDYSVSSFDSGCIEKSFVGKNQKIVANTVSQASTASTLKETTNCKSRMVWPVKNVNIIKDFDAPAKPWLAGHRGVDLQAEEGTELYAPSDGIINFAGLVAGKSVVTIKHGVLSSTFEPAYTDLPVGTVVRKGQFFGYVTVGSDHCDNLCIQWGLKRRNRTYANPRKMVAKKRIILKPKEETKEEKNSL